MTNQLTHTDIDTTTTLTRTPLPLPTSPFVNGEQPERPAGKGRRWMLVVGGIALAATAAVGVVVVAGNDTSDTVEPATNQRSASAIIQGEIDVALAARNPADAMVVQQPAYLIVQNEIDAATAELDGEIGEQRPTAQIVQDEIDAALAEAAATVEIDELRPAYLIVQDEIDAALAARTETSAN